MRAAQSISRGSGNTSLTCSGRKRETDQPQTEPRVRMADGDFILTETKNWDDAYSEIAAYRGRSTSTGDANSTGAS